MLKSHIIQQLALEKKIFLWHLTGDPAYVACLGSGGIHTVNIEEPTNAYQSVLFIRSRIIIMTITTIILQQSSLPFTAACRGLLGQM